MNGTTTLPQSDELPSAGDGPLPAAVLWDMDGTLIDSEPLWDKATNAIAARHGIAMTPDLQQATVGLSVDETLRVIYRAAGIKESRPYYHRDYRDLIAEVTGLFTTELSWRPGARDALQLITHLGIPMAMVTNTVRTIADIALDSIQRDTTGQEHFLVTVCGDEVLAGKPAPDPYQAAVRAMGVRADDCLVIEDSDPGARAASSAGCATLLVPSTPTALAALYPRCTIRASLADLTRADLQAAWSGSGLTATSCRRSGCPDHHASA